MDLQPRDNRKLLASWGQARLLVDWEGNGELIGGSETDREKAREWIGKFMQSKRVKGVHYLEDE